MIGISTYREQARWGVWDTAADLLPRHYADSVEAAGGIPVLLPPVAPPAARAVVARLDGLIISGGADVDPGRYDALPHAMTQNWREDRDAWECALLDAADSRDVPVLGICRGMQVMAVRGGGSLDQHVPDLVSHEEHSPGHDAYGTVDVETLPGTRLRRLVGDRHSVPCHHHQSVATHPGFVAAAVAADGTLEAIERPGPHFWVAVQWHPETVADSGLFRGLVAACTERWTG